MLTSTSATPLLARSLSLPPPSVSPRSCLSSWPCIAVKVVAGTHTGIHIIQQIVAARTLTKLGGVNTLPRSGALGANTVCCKLFMTLVIMFFIQWETCLCWSLAYSLDYAHTMPRLSHPLSTPLIMLVRTSIEHHSYYRYKIYSYEMPPCMSHRV